MKNIKYPNYNLQKIYLTLKDKPKNENSILIKKEKNNLLYWISKRLGKNINNVKSIFIGAKLNFGNQLKIINNAIFFCEIIGCKHLILDSKPNWFIRNTIIDKKYKLMIEVGQKEKYIKKNIFFDFSKFMYSYLKYIKPEFKVNLLKKEILRNFPKIQTNKKELYIYIRSGDIFIKPHYLYAQPPLCFYQKIIKDNKYTKILLISKDKNNPVIKYLLNNNSNIIYNQNSIKLDIAYLLYAYNLVGGFSTIIYTIIRFNDNLKYFWEYNVNIPSVHYTYYKLENRFTIYNMKPSNNYKKKMKFFFGNKEQLNLMITEKCLNNFVIHLIFSKNKN